MDFSELSIEFTEIESDKKLLKIKNCSTFEFALNFLTNEKFKPFILKSSHLIQVHVIINEEFKFLDENQLNKIGENFSTRSFLISFQSSINEKFFICWKFQNCMKSIVILEIIEDFFEDLEIVCNFLRNFLQNCYKNGETGFENLVLIVYCFNY